MITIADQQGRNYTLKRCTHLLPLTLMLAIVLILSYLLIWTLVLPVLVVAQTETLDTVLWYVFSVMLNLVFAGFVTRSPLGGGEPQLHLLVLMCVAQCGHMLCVVLARYHFNNAPYNGGIGGLEGGSTVLYSFQKSFLALSSFSYTLLTACRCFTKYLLTTCSTLQRILLTLLMLFVVSTGFGFLANTDRTATWLFLFIAPTLVTLIMVVYEKQLDAGHYFEDGLRYRTIVAILLVRTVLTIPYMVTRFLSMSDQQELPSKYCFRLFLWNSVLVPSIVICSEKEWMDLLFRGCGFSYEELDKFDPERTPCRYEPPQSNLDAPARRNYRSTLTSPAPTSPQTLKCVIEEDSLLKGEQTPYVAATTDENPASLAATTNENSASLPISTRLDEDDFCHIYDDGELKTMIFD